MKPSWTRIPILHVLYLEFCIIYCPNGEIMPILHCKIRLCFWSFFQILLKSMHGKHNILYQTGYIHHTKPFLGWFIEFSKLADFLVIIFKIPPLKEEANPMVVTSVVTYTFPIGPFLGAPSSGYGPSVDWGVQGWEHLLILNGAY